MHLCAILCLLLASLTCVTSSAGDRDPLYQQCVAHCVNECHDPLYQAPIVSPIIAHPSTLSLAERLLGWECVSDCGYQCQRAHHQHLSRTGLPTVKYFGKWPFERVMGVQELFSTVFSVANALPHIYYGVRYHHTVDSRYSMKRYWLLYCVVSVNTWLWSTVFHARDMLVTERLDYFCASLGVITSIAVQLIRTYRLRSLGSRMVVMLGCLSLLLCHIGYLQFVHFDYGWNMTVSLAIGLLYSVLSLATAARENRPWKRWIYWSHGYLWMVAMFEVWDFAPLWDLLDAHAVWHGLTPIIAVIFWRIMLRDAQFELELEGKRIEGLTIPMTMAISGQQRETSKTQ